MVVIVSMHIATGAWAGAAAGSRGRAVACGVVLHALCDAVPHRDIDSTRFEIVSGVALLALVVAGRSPLDPAVVGAVASCAPDLEHVLPLPQPRERKLFPTHRYAALHRAGGVAAWLQLVVAGAVVGAMFRGRATR